MSETTEPTPAPEPEPTPTPAPESTPETDEPGPAKEADEERQSRGDRRFAELTARLSAAERREQAREAELEFYRRQIAAQAPQDDTPEQAAQRLRMQVRAEVEAEIKKDNLHAQGNAQYPDWGQRAQRVVDMGGDAQFAQLVLDMPPGEAVKVVAALSEDPEALQRIVDLRSERARAVALGKYAATIDDAPPAQRSNGPAPQVTRAPAPIRPVTGRASPTFNEYTADGNTLVDRYMKQHLDQQQRR
jgi:hypothetical protein